MEAPGITIDLVSDTATRPSAAMFAAMAEAALGDEQRDEDPTTTALCSRVADLLGMEAAIFLPSGTMCNLIAFCVHCRPGDEIVCAANAHVFGSEAAGVAAVAGAQFRTIASETGVFTATKAEALLRPPKLRAPRSRVILVEQTSNRGGGSIWPVEVLADLVELGRRSGVILHMDGARLMNAAVASGVAPATFVRGFDSAWLDLSKGLGCPVGGVLAGTRAFIEEAWVWKHRLGGAMRQSGVLAAAGLYALDHNVARLADDHANARALAARLAKISGVSVFFQAPATNIVFIDVKETGLGTTEIAAGLSAAGVRMGVEDGHLLRAVTHLDVDRAGIDRAADAFARIVGHARA